MRNISKRIIQIIIIQVYAICRQRKFWRKRSRYSENVKYEFLASEISLKKRHTYELNVDKINTVDDCKKILKFLCDLTMGQLPSLPEGIEYGGFSEVSNYFD